MSPKKEPRKRVTESLDSISVEIAGEEDLTVRPNRWPQQREKLPDGPLTEITIIVEGPEDLTVRPASWRNLPQKDSDS